MQILRTIADELYRVGQEGSPRSSVGRDALSEITDIAIGIMKNDKMKAAVPAAQSIIKAAASMHGLPVFFNVGISPFGNKKKGSVTQT